MDDALAARGILYAPDFVANAGGILNIAEEFTGYSRDRALASTAAIEATIDARLRAREGVGDRAGPGRASGWRASGIAAEARARRPVGARRPGRVDERDAADPPAPRA